ncbi:MAG TPA: RNA polymerase sigma factor [Terriglobales bacterium]|nr:RNA polymerase sigma factor [Terriglobales bacterium]
MDLLRQFADGNLDAFETLFRQLQRDVYGWIVRIVRDPSLAEDLTIETFWRIYRARARFDPQGSLGGWARRIASNVALDYLRRSRREVELPENIPAPTGADPVLQRELQTQIGRALNDLSPKLRLTAILAFVGDLPYGEIAQALGTSEAAVKVRVFRAVRILRKKLKGFVTDYDRSRSATDSKTSEAGSGAN